MNDIRQWINIVESAQGVTVTRHGGKEFDINIDKSVFPSERIKYLELSAQPTEEGNLEFEGTLKGHYFHYIGIHNEPSDKQLYGSMGFTIDSHENIDIHDTEVDSEEKIYITDRLVDFDEDAPPEYDAHGGETEEYSEYYWELLYYIDEHIDLYTVYVKRDLEMILDYIKTNIGFTVDDFERARSTADDSLLGIE